MIARKDMLRVIEALDLFPAVAILGPRQVGKTTLALEIVRNRPAVYLDMENAEDRQVLADPVPYLSAQADHLTVIDEVQRMPDLFRALRGLIDQGCRAGKRKGRFPILGSAWRELLRQSSESLAGRIAYIELTPLLADEANEVRVDDVWLRGGFPESTCSRGRTRRASCGAGIS